MYSVSGTLITVIHSGGRAVVWGEKQGFCMEVVSAGFCECMCDCVWYLCAQRVLEIQGDGACCVLFPLRKAQLQSLLCCVLRFPLEFDF